MTAFLEMWETEDDKLSNKRRVPFCICFRVMISQLTSMPHGVCETNSIPTPSDPLLRRPFLLCAGELMIFL